MSTLAEVVKSFATEAKGKFTTEQLRQYLKTHHPDQWKDSTLQAHMYACAVGAEPNLSHRADRILSQGWKPTLRGSAVDKCRSWPVSLTSLVPG